MLTIYLNHPKYTTHVVIFLTICIRVLNFFRNVLTFLFMVFVVTCLFYEREGGVLVVWGFFFYISCLSMLCPWSYPHNLHIIAPNYYNSDNVFDNVLKLMMDSLTVGLKKNSLTVHILFSSWRRNECTGKCKEEKEEQNKNRQIFLNDCNPQYAWYWNRYCYCWNNCTTFRVQMKSRQKKKTQDIIYPRLG